MTLKVAIAQMNIALGQPEVNEQTVAQYAQKASEAGADILIYPEMWNTGYALTDLPQLADNDGEQSRHLLARLAKTYQLNIVVVRLQQCVMGDFSTQCLSLIS